MTTKINGTGNLTLENNRITGDFSNATVANRVLFQTSTVNGNTVLGAIPNGTGATAEYRIYSEPGLVNGAVGGFQQTQTDTKLFSGVYGTGTYLPMTFYTGGSERMRIGTDGNIGIGRASGTSTRIVSKSLGDTSGTFAVSLTDSADVGIFSIRDDGLILALKPSGIGYGTGAGGTVTQATSRTTAVTLNKPCGRITMFTAAGSATPALFAVNNSVVSATDTVIISLQSGASNNYVFSVLGVTAGQFVVQFYSASGTASDTPVLNFTVIKGATA